MIRCANPHAQYRGRQAAIDEAIRRVLQSGWYILGEEVRAFEREFAGYLGVAHAIGVANGSDALWLALRAAEIGPGDEVITVGHTAVATVAAIEQAGATPVLVDIEPRTYLINPELVESAITPRTRAILPVHLYGLPAAMTALRAIARAHQLVIIEDCAQAHGARYLGRRVGGIGDLGCFSFYPTKNLGAIGDGGMVVTNDDRFAERLRLLREYGWAERYVSHVPGWNSRLDELQAAVLRVKLRDLDRDTARREAIAIQYDDAFADLPVTTPVHLPDRQSVYHLYVVRTPRRDALQAYLACHGVGALIHYPTPIHRQPAYIGRLPGGDSLPETERAAREVLSLPMYPELTDDDVQTVIRAVRGFFEGA
ncbi:MAG: DegT/DnrJ/EryC1/StrS family aminotransferase [Dehalococcoidia bacterium]|nr:DegT/DnrJ/EryC1/StrS family aminotransferase [Dehalococcoidia bacterium]